MVRPWVCVNLNQQYMVHYGVTPWLARLRSGSAQTIVSQDDLAALLAPLTC